jgi:hypothetical protein
MTGTLRKFGAIALLSAVVAVPAFAHHSFAMFDDQQSVTLSGTVKEFQWTNPHVWLLVDVMDASGEITQWSLQGKAPSSLSRDGWTRSALSPGDKVTAIFHPMKDGSKGGSLVKASVNGNTFINETGHEPR